MIVPGPVQPAGPGPFRKPRFDLYTMLLLLSLAALAIGIVCLCLDTADYPGSPPWKDVPSVMLRVEGPAGLARGLPTPKSEIRNPKQIRITEIRNLSVAQQA